MKLQEISKKLNVSVSTISRVMNNKPGVNPTTREEVKKFLIVNNLMRDSENNNIAVIVPDFENPFFGEIVKEISHTLFKRDYQVSIYDTDENVEIEKKVIKNIIKNRVAGVILCISDGVKSIVHLEMLKEANIPVVLFDRETDFYLDGVFLNDFRAGSEATDKLIGSGCKNIAVIRGDMTLKHIKNRYNGYKYSLQKHNLDFNRQIVFEGDMKIKSGYEIMEQIVNEEKNNIDGILILNNFMTIGVLNYINNNNFSLYKKYKIFGFDVPDYVHTLNPSFNVVTRSKKEMGKQSAEMILKKLTLSHIHTQKIILEPIFK